MSTEKLAPCIECGLFTPISTVHSHVFRSAGRCPICVSKSSKQGVKPRVGDIVVHNANTKRDVAQFKKSFYRFTNSVNDYKNSINTLFEPIREKVREFYRSLSDELKPTAPKLSSLLKKINQAEKLLHIDNMNKFVSWIEKNRSDIDVTRASRFLDEISRRIDLATNALIGLSVVEYVLPPISANTSSPRIAQTTYKFYPVSGEKFYNAITKAVSGPLEKYRAFLTVYSKDEYEKMQCFLNEEGSAGYCITPEKDLVSVFNASKIKGYGTAAVTDAVSRGAETLDAYEGFLTKLYNQLGFEEYKRVKFDPKYAPPTWKEEEFGKPDVVFMRRKKEPVESIRLRDYGLTRLAHRISNSCGKIFRIEASDGVYILHSGIVAHHGLLSAIDTQRKIKAQLAVGRTKDVADGKYVMIHGRYAYDLNSLRALVADRFPNHEIVSLHVESPRTVAVKITKNWKSKKARTESLKMYIDNLTQAIHRIVRHHHDIFNHIENFMQKNGTENETVARQTDLPDNVDDLSIKWELHNVGGTSFGTGAQTGIMTPSGDHPLASVDVNEP